MTRNGYDRSSTKALDAPETTGHLTPMPRPNLREQLLSAGLETMYRKGFNATSVQDITDAAGAPKGSFYNHFASKEMLAAEAVRRYADGISARCAALRDRKLTPLQRLRTYFESRRASLLEAKFETGCMLGNFGAELSNQSPLISKRVEVAFDAWTADVAAVIAEAQKTGTVSRDVPARALAEFLINAWEGAVLRAKVEKSVAALEQFFEVTFTRILVEARQAGRRPGRR